MTYYTIYLMQEPRNVPRSYSDPEGMIAWVQVSESPNMWSCLITEEQLARRQEENRMVRGLSDLPKRLKRQIGGREAPNHVWGSSGHDHDPKTRKRIRHDGRELRGETPRGGGGGRSGRGRRNR